MAVKRGSIPLTRSMSIDPFAKSTTTMDTAVGGIDAKLDALLTSLKISESDRSRVAAGDLSKLSDAQVSALCAWYAESCGLHVSDVCAFRLDGKLRPYVRASGILRAARDKVQSIEHGSPQFVGQRTVLIECVVTLKDGTRWHDIAAREIVDSKSIMACSTAATVRALRLAIGIPIPSEGEHE